MIVSSEIILLGDGMVFCACKLDVLSDLAASTETQLQLLPLKLKIVGKELCEV